MTNNMYVVNIKPIAFQNIKLGTKKIEGRLEKGIFHEMDVADIIKFVNSKTKESVTKKVGHLKRYFNFERMLTDENMNDILPWCNDIEVGVKHYTSLYKNYNERDFPVLAIFIH